MKWEVYYGKMYEGFPEMKEFDTEKEAKDFIYEQTGGDGGVFEDYIYINYHENMEYYYVRSECEDENEFEEEQQNKNYEQELKGTTIWVVFRHDTRDLGGGVTADTPDISRAFLSEERAKEYMFNLIDDVGVEKEELEEDGCYWGKNDEEACYYYERAELEY